MAKVDFTRNVGRIKPMHAVNNGPVYKHGEDQRLTNLHAYREAGIPYARNHDASFCNSYGGEHTVDVHAIFPNFDADPYDAANYDFVCTDRYLQTVEAAGTKVFYRLGTKIEHEIKKYHTLPPKDFHKWAVICEHIVRHYTQGWAEGFHMDIEYWEIWNEPDLWHEDFHPADRKTTWGGTQAQFYDLFEITAKHLKQCFPHLKVGGPALACMEDWAERFLAEMQRRSVPMDFFSYHIYADEPAKLVEKNAVIEALVRKYGYRDAELINDEWNYVRGWQTDEWLYSLKTMVNLKGAAFIAACMSAMQYTSLDMLMYYDARPCGMNGMFHQNFLTPLKGYYPFWMFNKLYRMGQAVAVEAEEAVYLCAASSHGGKAVMVTYYADEPEAERKQVALTLAGLGQGEHTLQFSLLDENHDTQTVRQERVVSDTCTVYLEMPIYSTYLIEIH